MEAVSPARLRGPFRVKTIVAEGGLVLRAPPRCTGEPGTPSPALRPPVGASVLHVGHRVCGEGRVGAGLEARPAVRSSGRRPAEVGAGVGAGPEPGSGPLPLRPSVLPGSAGAVWGSRRPRPRRARPATHLRPPAWPEAAACAQSKSHAQEDESPRPGTTKASPSWGRSASARGLGRRRPCSARPRHASEDPSPRFPSAAQRQGTRGIDRTCRSAFAPEQRGRRSAARA